MACFCWNKDKIKLFQQGSTLKMMEAHGKVWELAFAWEGFVSVSMEGKGLYMWSDIVTKLDEMADLAQLKHQTRSRYLHRILHQRNFCYMIQVDQPHKKARADSAFVILLSTALLCQASKTVQQPIFGDLFKDASPRASPASMGQSYIMFWHLAGSCQKLACHACVQHASVGLCLKISYVRAVRPWTRCGRRDPGCFRRARIAWSRNRMAILFGAEPCCRQAQLRRLRGAELGDVETLKCHGFRAPLPTSSCLRHRLFRRTRLMLAPFGLLVRAVAVRQVGHMHGDVNLACSEKEGTCFQEHGI